MKYLSGLFSGLFLILALLINSASAQVYITPQQQYQYQQYPQQQYQYQQYQQYPQQQYQYQQYPQQQYPQQQYQYQQYPQQQYPQQQYQQYPPTSPEQILNLQDQYAVQSFATRSGQMDYRYTAFLNGISNRFNRAGPLVFHNYNNKDVQYVVIPGAVGLNAVAFHRSIIIDSIQMDTFRKISEGIVYYGTIHNPYTDAVLKKAYELNQIVNTGSRIPANYGNLENPFGFPTLSGNVNAATNPTAMKIFEEMVAANLAHEGAHAFREHNKNRLLMQQSLWMKYGGNSQNQQLLADQIKNYINTTFSKEMEYEADSYGVRLLKASGYSLNGFINWMIIGEKFENLMGVYGDFPGRTHPTCPSRIQNAQKVWNRY